MASATWRSRSFGTTIERVDGLLELRDAEVRLGRALATFESERTRHDADREGAEVPRDLGHDGGAAGARASPFAGGDEHHVGALQDLLDLVGMLFRCAPPDIGIGAGTEAARGLSADVELDLGVGHQQGLRVRVDSDELHAMETCLDHPVHGVHAASADPHDLDHGEVVLRSIHHPKSLPGPGPPTWRTSPSCSSVADFSTAVLELVLNPKAPPERYYHI